MLLQQLLFLGVLFVIGLLVLHVANHFYRPWGGGTIQNAFGSILDGLIIGDLGLSVIEIRV